MGVHGGWMEGLFVGWLIATVGLVVSARVIHIFVVVRALRSRGHGPLTGWMLINHYGELMQYKKICLAEGRSLAWWRALVTLQVLMILGVLGAILLGFLQVW